ncbi:V-type ATP synthase subunit D, partial [mine drainage metagenome]
MPNLEVTRPTRLELIRAKRRIVLAKRGLNLLKLKRSALIAEFFKISRQALELRGDLAQRLKEGYSAIREAEFAEGRVRLESVSLMLPQLQPLSVESRNVMGVRTPAIADARYDPETARA